MKIVIVVLILIPAVAFMGCSRSEVRWVRKLEGRWNVSRYLLTEIDSSGEVATISDIENAGFYDFKEAELNGLQLEGQLEFHREWNINGTIETTDGVGSIDEESARVIMYGGTCVQCDTFYTIEEDQKNHKVWSKFVPDNNYLLSRHLQLTLERE